MKNIVLSFLIATMVHTPSAYAIDSSGNGDTSDIVSLYKFGSTTSNTVSDTITTNPVNLAVVSPGGVIRNTTNIEFLQTPYPAIRSTTAATKIIESCKATNEITIEAWITSGTDNDLSVAKYGPARIMSLSNGVSGSSGIYLGQGYDGGHFYNVAVNSRQVLDDDELNVEGEEIRTEPEGANGETRRIVRTHSLQQIIFTKDSSGMARLFVSDETQTPILRSEMRLDETASNLSRWGNDLRLTIGNDAKFNEDAGLPLLRETLNDQEFGTRTIEDKDWRGKVHALAIYCKALDNNRILGAKAPKNWLTEEENVAINPSTPLTPEIQLARAIYRRLNGHNLPVGHPVLSQMARKLSGDMNNIDKRVEVAAIASDRPGFYNRLLKDFAKQMSNREHDVTVPLNDFSAMVIGATRENLDARDLLRTDLYYFADPVKTAVPTNLIGDILTSNNHFETLETLGYDLKTTLIRRTGGQVFYDGKGGVRAAKDYDAAGLLTSRAFMSAHAVAGTNRRLVEYSFSEFLCRPISQWADNKAPDAWVGRDVDRFPSGSHEKYQVNCRGCHGQMDALRGAFARVSFETGFIKHTWVVDADASQDADEANNNENMATVVEVPIGVVAKYNRATNIYSTGKPTTDSSWFNYATKGTNATYFQWKPDTLAGNGIRQYGNMLAESGAFATCMVERVFKSVCKRTAVASDKPVIDRVVASFKNANGDNYKLRRLFERMVVQPECLGQ